MSRRKRNRNAPLREIKSARRGVYLVPNLLTSAGLFCGIFAIVVTTQSHFIHAALAILAAQIFDILDGRVARLTNTTSRFGTEYDSLCDLVSFGVAPGMLIYRWALTSWGAWGWLAIALFVTCSALRLARYNTMISVLPRGHFLGLPVPAASAMLASVVLMYKYVGRSGLPDKHVTLLLITYALAILMVSNIPYNNFKTVKLNKRQPLWLLVVGVLFLKVMVVAYPLVIFTSASIYVASGPALWAWHGLHDRGDDAGSGDDAGGDDEADGNAGTETGEAGAAPHYG